MKKIIIASDGGARGNGLSDCVSAYGALLEFDGHRKEISKGFIGMTNNQMELMGFIEALKCLNQPCEIDAYLDSKYVLDGCKSWLAGWKRSNWRTSTKKPVKNSELWKELDELIQKHKINYIWVRGHQGHHLNERCDQLCNEEMDKLESDKKEIDGFVGGEYLNG
ncbi:MAG: ribonuclease HI [Sarcina sp.]